MKLKLSVIVPGKEENEVSKKIFLAHASLYDE